MVNTLYGLVPKDPAQNLAFRKDLVLAGAKDPELAADLRAACAADLLFFCNFACFTYDPRLKKARAIPFITFPFQDDALLKIEEAIDSGHDLLIEKSRDMGASWMNLLVFLHRWQFSDLQSFLVISRNEDYVDKPGDAKSLFWKLDFLLKWQPRWLLPNFNRQKRQLRNLDNESTITGESTTDNAGRGDRKTAILIDEFGAFESAGVNGFEVLAATTSATDCRISNSTHKGRATAFFAQKKAMPPEHVVRLHWTQDPRKNQGLRWVGGKPTSDWYERECKRYPLAALVAQELDCDPMGAQTTFFETGTIDSIKARDGRPAYLTGKLEVDLETLQPGDFKERADGHLRLWTFLHGGKPPAGRYVAGVDVSNGTGASNSCVSVADCRTGEKVAEFAFAGPGYPPEKFAVDAVAIFRWFHGAFAVWEAAGPGSAFGQKVIELGYRHVYFHTQQRSLSKKQSDTPGWWPTASTKFDMLADYRSALGDRFVNRSARALDECLEYVYDSGGGVEHSAALKNPDQSTARARHGDLVIADGLCWLGLCELGAGKRRAPGGDDGAAEVLPGSLAWRRQIHEQRDREKETWLAV